MTTKVMKRSFLNVYVDKARSKEDMIKFWKRSGPVFTKILIIRITLILRIFQRIAFILRIFLRVRICYSQRCLFSEYSNNRFKYLRLAQRVSCGSVGGCWTHNPRVVGSIPGDADCFM